jgi:hypothetical protein
MLLLLFLARQHLDSINTTVLKEIVKSLAHPEKEEKPKPGPSNVVKRSSADTKIEPHSLNRRLAEWIVADGLPFHAIEGRGFHNLMNLLRPDVDYPGRLTVMKQLPIMASEVQVKIQQQIRKMLAVSFTLDFWSAADKFKSGFMSVNLTGITCDMDFVEATIAMELIPGKHTASVTAKALAAVLARYNVTAKNIGGITTDDGSAMAPGIAEFLKTKDFGLGASDQFNNQATLALLWASFKQRLG